MKENKNDFKPYIPADQVVPEFTVTALILGILLAVIFGAANAYLGLRVGMTVSASIPAAVMGGVCLILYGFIASNGLKTLIDAKVDMSDTRNLIIVSVMLVIGLGAGTLKITDDIQFSGMALATIFGIVLNLTLPKEFAKNKDKK